MLGSGLAEITPPQFKIGVGEYDLAQGTGTQVGQVAPSNADGRFRQDGAGQNQRDAVDMQQDFADELVAMVGNSQTLAFFGKRRFPLVKQKAHSQVMAIVVTQTFGQRTGFVQPGL